MKSFAASALIQATPEAVWAILTDAAAYPEWNPTVERITGKIELGGRIRVAVKSNPGRTFPLLVSEFVPCQKMVWSGNMPLGLFRGVRTFTLVGNPDGVVEFAMWEVYSGLLASWITKSIPDLQPDFDAFAQALKTHAERG